MLTPVDVEAEAVTLLSAALGVHVATRVPDPRPAQCVRVTRAGGQRRNLIQEQPLLLVECWAGDDVAAFALAADAWAALDGTDWSAALSSPVSFPDPDTSSPRYQFTASLLVNLSEVS